MCKTQMKEQGEKGVKLIAPMAVVFFCVAVFGFTCFAETNQLPQQVDIAFYGKVIDQSNQPVTDATVHVLVYRTEDSIGKATTRIAVKTDANGLFQLTGKGSSTAIATIKKKGYEFTPAKSAQLKYVYSTLQPKEVFTPNLAQ